MLSVAVEESEDDATAMECEFVDGLIVAAPLACSCLATPAPINGVPFVDDCACC